MAQRPTSLNVSRGVHVSRNVPLLEKVENMERTEPKHLRFLLLEDDPIDAELVQLELQKALIVFDARRVQTREEFERELKIFAPDIILADYSLPQFTAIDALKMLHEQQSEIPLILVTGSQSEDVAVECLKQGASDYILKQSLARLPSAILNVLKKQKVEREKREAERALQQSEERFRLLFANNPLPLFVFDVDSLKLIEVNDAAIHHYGYSREEFLQMWITDLWLLNDLPAIQPEIQQLKKNSAVRGFWTHRRKDHEERHVHVEMQRIEFPGRNAALLVAHDITEQKRGEEKLRASREQLRALSGHLQSIREEERARIAREIHDELGQLLTALSMDASWLQKKLSQVEPSLAKPMKAQLTSMINMIDSAIQQVRKIAAELRPRVLDDLGLVPAIEWQVQEFQARTGIRCRLFTNTEEIHLDQELATAVFRILQESLTNIARHAYATRAEITLNVAPDRLLLEVRDDGVGISNDVIGSPSSLGLLGMKERATLLGGSLTVKGEHKQGTTVTVEIPLTLKAGDG